MGKLTRIDPICACGGELVIKHFFLNSLSEKKEYEFIVECSRCCKRDNFKLPFTIYPRNLLTGGSDDIK